jgi:hypothetical protein
MKEGPVRVTNAFWLGMLEESFIKACGHFDNGSYVNKLGRGGTSLGQLNSAIQ